MNKIEPEEEKDDGNTCLECRNASKILAIYGE